MEKRILRRISQVSLKRNEERQNIFHQKADHYDPGCVGSFVAPSIIKIKGRIAWWGDWL